MVTWARPSFSPVHFDAGRAKRSARDSTGAEKSTGIPDRPSVAKRPHGSSFECIHIEKCPCPCPQSAEATSNSVLPFDARNWPGFEVGSRMKSLNGPFQGEKLVERVKLNFRRVPHGELNPKIAYCGTMTAIQFVLGSDWLPLVSCDHVSAFDMLNPKIWYNVPIKAMTRENKRNGRLNLNNCNSAL